uniref:Uncharacterized protein n=1 Tax=Brassica oleracea var. oleracea TaxID=109376 RepID=A0A0D3D639_BRAOL
MAERRLNFKAPLLSTRRLHNTAVSVRRNKSINFTHDSKTSELGLDQVTEAASVPFTWEQSPGRLKGHDSKPQQVSDQVFTPCLPPGNLSFRVKHVEEEEEEDVFSDARDTYSYFSANHSITGVSGYSVVETKNPSEDHQSRDFMLNRFLPAAKAMTVEQPHYGSNRKPSTFMPEPTIQKRDLVPDEKRQTRNRYDKSTLLPYYDHHQGVDNEESVEEDDDEVSEYAYLSRRGCGMFPQLCFKESVAMLSTGFQSKQNSPSHDQVKSSKVSQLKSRFQSIKQVPALASFPSTLVLHKLGGKVLSTVHPNLSSAASMSSSPYRHTRCMSPFRNGSPFHPDTRKETESLRANRLNKHISNISNASASSLLEKTVYVDTEDSPKTNIKIFPEEVEKKPDTNLELEELGKINSSPGRSLLAPPLPNKPSESWLFHNLPSVVNSQSPSRRYTFQPQKQSFNENSTNVTKWETIVKTSYMHRDHIRYSDELVAHTSLQ